MRENSIVGNIILHLLEEANYCRRFGANDKGTEAWAIPAAIRGQCVVEMPQIHSTCVWRINEATESFRLGLGRDSSGEGRRLLPRFGACSGGLLNTCIIAQCNEGMSH